MYLLFKDRLKQKNFGFYCLRANTNVIEYSTPHEFENIGEGVGGGGSEAKVVTYTKIRLQIFQRVTQDRVVLCLFTHEA